MSAHTRMLDASETVGMNDTEGACQHAGHDVAEDDWLAQSLEDERRTAGDDEDDRQVGNERCDGGHGA